MLLRCPRPVRPLLKLAMVTIEQGARTVTGVPAILRVRLR